MNEDFLTAKQAAQIIGVAQTTFYSIVKARKLYPYKLDGKKERFYKRSEVEKLTKKVYL